MRILPLVCIVIAPIAWAPEWCGGSSIMVGLSAWRVQAVSSRYLPIRGIFSSIKNNYIPAEKSCNSLGQGELGISLNVMYAGSSDSVLSDAWE
jgi:hypothetical protein